MSRRRRLPARIQRISKVPATYRSGALLLKRIMSDKQVQKSGDASLNIQGRDISIGLTYSEARQVAMDVFEANFYRLQSVAAETAYKRAEEFLDSYFEKMAENQENSIPEAQNPDFQYALYSAQKEYARTGDKELGELLVQLLADRTEVRSRNLVQIVLNESLSVAPKLTVDQLDILSLVFILRYTRRLSLGNLNAFADYLDRFIEPFISGVSEKQSAYQHLEFAGCVNINVTQLLLEEVFRRNYPGLYSKGFGVEEINEMALPTAPGPSLLIRCLRAQDKLQINALNEDDVEGTFERLRLSPEQRGKLKQLHDSNLMSQDEIKDDVIRLRPYMKHAFDKWTSTPLKNLTLTSVGIAIGHANMQRRVGESFDLTIWI